MKGLPAFRFDGADKSVIENSGDVLTVEYRNGICSYQMEDENIRGTDRTGYSRNGRYRLFRAEGKDRLTVKIDIFPI